MSSEGSRSHTSNLVSATQNMIKRILNKENKNRKKIHLNICLMLLMFQDILLFHHVRQVNFLIESNLKQC